LGYVEGQHFALEIRSADGQAELLPQLAVELVQLRPDVIVVASGPETAAARQATSTIPIIFAAHVDPLTNGVVASLARPGGNVTGLSTLTPPLGSKRLELIKATVPGLSRIAALGLAGSLELRAAEAAAQSLGVELEFLSIQRPEDLPGAFEIAAQSGAETVTILQAPALVGRMPWLAELAALNRMPAISDRRAFTDAGGLMSYGPDLPDLWRRAAAYVDRILAGTFPGDLPVEQARQFQFVINLKTAQALGLTIPPQVLAQATEVLQ
jgi:putative ABC transport system substrate-binding protein